MDDLKRAQWITANYHRLQGLKRLPWYIWLLILASVYAAGFTDSMMLNNALGICLLPLPSVVVPWWLSRQIGRYYERTFGSVSYYERTVGHASLGPDEQLQLSQPIPWYKVVQKAAVGIFIIGASVGLVVGGVLLWEYLTKRLHMSEMFIYITAMLILSNVWIKGRLLPHYLIAAILLIALSTLSLLGLLPGGSWPKIFGLPLDLVISFIVLISAGILDHLTLVRAFKHMPEEDNDAGV